MGERQSIAQKGVRAIDAEIRGWKMAQMLQKPVFASVNTLLCDTLGLAEKICKNLRKSAFGLGLSP